MILPLALRIALREMRGGLRGFRVFLLCLALGVAAIAAVGTVRASITAALTEQGAALLGGDAQVSFTYRRATAEERAFIDAHATRVSEIIDFRSMAVAGEGTGAQRVLTQVKAVDDAYPLVGAVVLEPKMGLPEALAPRQGVAGAVMDGVLADRLGLATGDEFRLGLSRFRLSARLVRTPDGATGGLLLGLPTIVRAADLEGSGLLDPGALFDSRYRMLVPAGTDLAALQAKAEAAFPDRGLRWLDARRGAPGAERFVDRMGSFLVLVGLAALAVGGIGVALAVRSHLEGKTETIATLKAMGAEGGTVLAAYLTQVGVMAALGIGAGLAAGVALPVVGAPLAAPYLPLAVAVDAHARPLLEAAVYGALTAALFAIWPLSAVRRVRAAALFRAVGGGPRWPGLGAGLLTAALAAALVGMAIALSDLPWLAASTLGGVAVAMAFLALAALGLRRVSRGLAHRVRGWPALRLALAAVGGPSREAGVIVVALGLGLSVLAAVGQIDANLRMAIDRDLPKAAPAFFFIDIQADQIDPFKALLADDPEVSRVETAPMLRGVLTRINGQDARTVAGDHWVVRGDRGLTFSATPPPGTKIVAGQWWAPDHSGPPEMSFAAEEAAEIGLSLGDRVTVNVLGREIEATVTSLREVDFSTAGIGFVMALDPAALAGAPHTYIATVYAPPAAEAHILRSIGEAFVNVTAIPVREVAARVAEMLGAIASAAALASGVTLAVGGVVLLGAAASGAPARAYEAAILKTLGATRPRVLAGFLLRFLVPGLVAGLVAVAAGAAAGWAVMRLVMDAHYTFVAGTALAVVAGGIAAALAAGLAFAWPAANRPPAATLRAPE